MKVGAQTLAVSFSLNDQESSLRAIINSIISAAARILLSIDAYPSVK